jgi:hypothetical protein
MARTERKYIPAQLHCNNCQGEFEGEGRHVRIVSDAGGPSEWIPDTNGADGNICPHYGSELIGFARD